MKDELEGLSNRARRILLSIGIDSKAKLLAVLEQRPRYGVAELLKEPGLGLKTIKEIVAWSGWVSPLDREKAERKKRLSKRGIVVCPCCSHEFKAFHNKKI